MIDLQQLKVSVLHYSEGIFKSRIISVYIPLAIMLVAVANYYWPVLKYNVNVPCSDDYGVALQFLNDFTVENSFWGKISILFRQHVDHRVMFPRLAVLMDFYIQGKVNFYSLVIFGNLGLLGIAAILFISSPKVSGKLLLFSPVVLLLFQLQHWENSGFPTASIQSFYVIFFSFTSLYLLNQNTRSSLALACLLFFMAVFTSGNGMFCILPGAFIVFNQRRFAALGIWMVTFVSSVSFYFFQYANQSSGRLLQVMEKPLEMLTTFFVAIGGFINFSKAWEPIGTGYPLSIAFGVLITIFFLYLTFSKYYLRAPVLYSFLFFLMITGAAMAVSRASQYSANELSTISRYKIVSLCSIAASYLILIDIWPGMTLLKALVFIPLAYNYHNTANKKNIEIYIAHTDRLVQSSWAVHSNNDYSKLVDWNPTLSAQELIESQEKGIYILPDLTDEYLRRAPQAKELIYDSWASVIPADSTVKYEFTLQPTKKGDVYGIRRGWALAKMKTTKRNIFVLKSGSKSYFFSISVDYRDDLSAMMNQQNPEDKTNYSESGFNFSLKTDQLDKGEYKAGIVMETWDNFRFYIPAQSKVIVK